MKKLLLFTLLMLNALSTFAQKTIDYTTYDIIAKASNVTVLVKDNDYRMVVGSLKKPKATFLLGYTKEQASKRFESLLEITSNNNYSKSERQVFFCGQSFHLAIKGSGDKERYSFTKYGDNVKFELSKQDVLTFKESAAK